jgi:hypothetical protein
MKNRGIIVISSLVVIGGGVAFLLWKLNKKKEEQKLKDEEAAKAASSTNTNTGGGGSTGGGGGSTGGGTKPSTFTFPFKTEAEGNAFRAYVRLKDKDFAKSIALDATGKLNSNVQKAWEKYGADYLKETKPKVDNPIVPKKGNTLAEVTANAKANGYTVETYTDRIVAKWSDNKFNAQNTYFYPNGTFISEVVPYWYGTTKLHQGTWEDSGNIMRLNVTKRVLSDGIKSNLERLFDVNNV